MVKKLEKIPAMRYTGKGAFLPGIPRRDLTPEEVARLGGVKKLEKTGLYEIKEINNG